MTDNERDAQTIREALEDERLHPEPSDTPFGVDGCSACAAIAALARLVAALSAATTDRDEALADRDGARRGEDEAWEKWQVAERRAEALAAQLQQAREALRQIADGEFVTRETGRGRSLVDGVDTEVVYVRDVGVREIARAALAAAAPATTLNEPEAAREAAVLADVLAGRNPETWASLHRPLDHLREQEIRRLVFGGELYRWGTEATAIEDLLREIDRLRAAAAAVPNEAEQGQ